MRSTSRVVVTALATAATMVLIGACSGGTNTISSSPPADNVLELPLNGDIGQPPDPDVFYGGAGLMITTNVYEGLVEYQSGVDEPVIVPRLATEWQVSPDFTTFSFTLRPGVTFHDGTPLTSDAVRKSIERRAAVGRGPAYMVEGITSVRTPSDLAVEIVLDGPNSAFLDFLASPYGLKIMSPALMQANAGDDFGQTFLRTNDAGSGPYRMVTAEVGERYALEEYDGYWGDKPTFSGVNLSVYSDVSAMQLAFNNGDLAALVGSVPSAAQGDYAERDDVASYRLPTYQTGFIHTNMNRPFFADRETRMAFKKLLEPQVYIDQFMSEKAEIATGLYGKGILPDADDSITREYDPAPMQAIIDGLPADQKSIVLGHNSASVDDAQIANLIAAKLISMGLQATVQAYPSSQINSFADDPSTGPDVLFTSQTWPDAGNPYMWGHVFWDLDGGLNTLQCGDNAAAALLKNAVATNDSDEYARAARAYEDTGCTTTVSYVQDFVVAQTWLGGVAEAHAIAEPYTLDLEKLTVK
ncbi:ABC transporter substrate-binding protein [Rhodococcoides kyotonense]|uniref:Peptide/nickel transport system substrate-binding protein n=1 Tax=Rhodococcoides kyotonense TaxID=398843 RepID=A0A239N2G2_9NOCA|nr:ABC transporter substrate-binding protein [Rhodococcus kyotonensis]SNT48624.1 peptide/nickel transport system substrate-binding protein [Rhodococcus kyotonensis]